jgi:hypothetical protein
VLQLPALRRVSGQRSAALKSPRARGVAAEVAVSKPRQFARTVAGIGLSEVSEPRVTLAAAASIERRIGKMPRKLPHRLDRQRLQLALDV